MKYSVLSSIVNKAAQELRLDAQYNVARDDGGCQRLLSRLDVFKKSLVEKMDLKPSEYYQLDNVEVWEPEEFSVIIHNYKMKLAKNIKL